jgi:hypothetical protein
VLAPSPTPALTQKHVSTSFNKFQLGLQFITKQDSSRKIDFWNTLYICSYYTGRCVKTFKAIDMEMHDYNVIETVIDFLFVYLFIY